MYKFKHKLTDKENRALIILWIFIAFVSFVIWVGFWSEYPFFRGQNNYWWSWNINFTLEWKNYDNLRWICENLDEIYNQVGKSATGEKN